MPNDNFADAYTRLIITSRHTRQIKGDPRSPSDRTLPTETYYTYPYNDRGWVARLFWGTQYSITVTAQVTVGTGDTRFDATVPLVTLSHTSNRTEGERFDRQVNHSMQNFPLFLVKGDGSNSIAKLKFTAKASDKYDGGVGAAVIKAAQGVITVVAPESSVLTKLNAQKGQDAARAIDQAIAEIYAKSVTEQQQIENDVRRWNDGAQLTVKVPNWKDETNWSDDNNFHAVGSWSVTFEDPRPSIFSSIQLCPQYPRDSMEMEPQKEEAGKAKTSCPETLMAAATRAQDEAKKSPHQVLAFQLVNGTGNLGTVLGYMKQQDWWDTAQKAFGAATLDDAAVTAFCRNIKNEAAKLQLNRVDGGIIAVAMQDAALLPKAIITSMAGNSDCGHAVK